VHYHEKISVFFNYDISCRHNNSPCADCTEVGKRVATEQGGTLARATLDTQNGNTCVVIVLIPARDGEKPRRVEVAVPAN